MPVPTGRPAEKMSLVIRPVISTPCDRLNVQGGTSPLFHPPRDSPKCPILSPPDRFRLGRHLTGSAWSNRSQHFPEADFWPGKRMVRAYLDSHEKAWGLDELQESPGSGAIP